MSGFKPAAIAMHPVTDRLFVVSSVRKLLVAIAPDNTIDAVWPLPEDLASTSLKESPFCRTGICLFPMRAEMAKATLLRFNYR